MKVDKSLMKASNGNYKTQSLFLEECYDAPEGATYTLGEEDKEYKGKTYYSLKRLYLECEDPHEYDFACMYLCNFKHWQRLVNNKKLRVYIDEWREELSYKIRSTAVRDIISLSAEGQGSFQACKWLADMGWDKRAAGRPSREEVDKRVAQDAKLYDEFEEDFNRLKVVK